MSCNPYRRCNQSMNRVTWPLSGELLQNTNKGIDLSTKSSLRGCFLYIKNVFLMLKMCNCPLFKCQANAQWDGHSVIGLCLTFIRMGYDFDIINNGTSNAFHGYTCVYLEDCFHEITRTWGAGGMGQALGALAVPSRGLEFGSQRSPNGPWAWNYSWGTGRENMGP